MSTWVHASVLPEIEGVYKVRDMLGHEIFAKWSKVSGFKHGTWSYLDGSECQHMAVYKYEV